MFLVAQDFVVDLLMWPHCEKTKKALKRKEIYSVVVWNAHERTQVLN